MKFNKNDRVRISASNLKGTVQNFFYSDVLRDYYYQVLFIEPSGEWSLGWYLGKGLRHCKPKLKKFLEEYRKDEI